MQGVNYPANWLVPKETKERGAQLPYRENLYRRVARETRIGYGRWRND